MRLKELRTAQKLFQKELAEMLGVDRTTYSKYESGASEPNHETLLKLAEIFGVSTDYLLGREEKEKPTPVSESGPLYPPEYDLLNPEDKELVDGMIRSLAKKKSVD